MKTPDICTSDKFYLEQVELDHALRILLLATLVDIKYIQTRIQISRPTQAYSCFIRAPWITVHTSICQICLIPESPEACENDSELLYQQSRCAIKIKRYEESIWRLETNTRLLCRIRFAEPLGNLSSETCSCKLSANEASICLGCSPLISGVLLFPTPA